MSYQWLCSLNYFTFIKVSVSLYKSALFTIPGQSILNSASAQTLMLNRTSAQLPPLCRQKILPVWIVVHLPAWTSIPQVNKISEKHSQHHTANFFLKITVIIIQHSKHLSYGIFWCFFFTKTMKISIFMPPPPLGARGIMFTGCPSIRPCVCPYMRVCMIDCVCLKSSECINGFFSNLVEG